MKSKIGAMLFAFGGLVLGGFCSLALVSLIIQAFVEHGPWVGLSMLAITASVPALIAGIMLRD